MAFFCLLPKPVSPIRPCALRARRICFTRSRPVVSVPPDELRQQTSRLCGPQPTRADSGTDLQTETTMKRINWLRWTVLLRATGWAVVLSAIPLPLTAATAEVQAPVPAQALAERFQQTPPQFVENRGQWPDSAVRFALSRGRVNVALTANGPRFQLWRAAGTESKARSRHLVMEPSAVLTPEEPSPQRKEFTAIFLNAHSVVPTGESQSQELFHFRHGEASQWRENVPGWEAVIYRQLYDGIALRVSSRSHGIKYEFQVAPGADWRQVRLRYDGIERLALTDKGALQIKLGDNWAPLVDAAPVIYQIIDGHRQNVAGRFVLVDDRTCAFDVSGSFDPQRPLIIDPEIEWGAYLGGYTDDYANDVAVDRNGNVLITGETFSSDWVSGGYDTNFSAPRDAFVVKLSPTGAPLGPPIWAAPVTTWVKALPSMPRGMSMSQGYPLAALGERRIQHQLQRQRPPRRIRGQAQPDGCACLVHLHGRGQLGKRLGHRRRSFHQRARGRLEESSGWISGGFSTSYHGGRDAFVVKLSGDGALLWSSYLGGGAPEEGWSVAADGSDNVLVAGGTRIPPDGQGVSGTSYFGTTFNGGITGSLPN